MLSSFQRARWLGRVVLAAACLVVGGCRSTHDAGEPGRELRERTFDFYWRVLDDDFPYFDESGADWGGLRDRYRTRAIEAPDAFSYYRTLSEMFAHLQDPHLFFETRRVDLLRASPGFGWMAPALVDVGRQAYIWSWADSGGCFGHDIETYPQLLGRRNRPWTRHELASDLALFESMADPDAIEAVDQDGGRFRVEPMPRRNPALGAVERVVDVRDFRANFMEGTPFEVPGTGQASVQVLVDDLRLYRNPIRQSPFNQLRERESRSPTGPRPWWIDAKRVPGAGYLRLSTFSAMEGTQRPHANFGGVLASELLSIIDSPCLIVDVRYNGGGNRTPVQDALNWFSARPIDLRLSSWKLKPHVLRRPVIFSVRPVGSPFRGRVVVLVNRFSASAAEVFAQFMREHNGAIIVGETTIGAEAGVEAVTGPDGSTLSYGSIPFRYPGTASFQTRGIVPDVQVPLTITRVREIGYEAAVLENEVEQMRAACRVLGLDADAVLAGNP